MLAIVDYEAGNLTSVYRAIKHLGVNAKITQDPKEIESAERVIFPGVGAAGASMKNIKHLGLDKALIAAVERKKPVLGICVGCQIIFENSEEDDTSCLGLLSGRVLRFSSDMKESTGKKLKVPHMGWNQVRWLKPHPVFKDLPEDAQFYFVHSYYPEPCDQDHILGVCDYGGEFACAVAKGSLAAVQFHTEKSGEYGLKILSNFQEWDGSEV